MRTEQEILDKISEVTEANDHLLSIGPATIDVNAPRALMQIGAVCKLEALYFCLGKKRPLFTCDDTSKTNM